MCRPIGDLLDNIHHPQEILNKFHCYEIINCEDWFCRINIHKEQIISKI